MIIIFKRSVKKVDGCNFASVLALFRAASACRKPEPQSIYTNRSSRCRTRDPRPRSHRLAMVYRRRRCWVSSPTILGSDRSVLLVSVWRCRRCVVSTCLYPRGSSTLWLCWSKACKGLQLLHQRLWGLDPWISVRDPRSTWNLCRPRISASCARTKFRDHEQAARVGQCEVTANSYYS